MDGSVRRKTKHILRHAYELRDRVARRVYAPEFVPTADQLADILTKSLRVAQHRDLTGRLLAAPLDKPTRAADQMVPKQMCSATVEASQEGASGTRPTRRAASAAGAARGSAN